MIDPTLRHWIRGSFIRAGSFDPHISHPLPLSGGSLQQALGLLFGSSGRDFSQEQDNPSCLSVLPFAFLLSNHPPSTALLPSFLGFLRHPSSLQRAIFFLVNASSREIRKIFLSWGAQGPFGAGLRETSLFPSPTDNFLSAPP